MGNPFELVLSAFLLLSALGVILVRKPVHACLSFLASLLLLAIWFLQESAHFIAIMQILVYAGAILVIFMFVIILFQDAYLQISRLKASSTPLLLEFAGLSFVLLFIYFGIQLIELIKGPSSLPEGFGTVQALGKAIYTDYFFPFEAVIPLFLVAVIGAFTIGRKEY